MTNRVIRLVVLVLLLGVVAIWAVYNQKIKHSSGPVVTIPGQVQGFDLKSARLLSNGDFEFVSKSDVRLRCRLKSSVPPDAKSEIIRLLNSAEKGKIIILECEGDVCTVDVFLTVRQIENGVTCLKELNLLQWLQQNKLTYQVPRPH